MGQFRFEFTATGGHGCQRDAKEGEKFYGCRRMGCPDCECKRFVEHMKALGFPVERATFTHWPGTETEVVDDLASGNTAHIRKSNDFFNSKNKPQGG